MAGRIGLIDAVRRNIAVPPQIARVADSAGAVLDRILIAVHLDRVAGDRIDGAGQSPVVALQAARARDLPAADDLLQGALGVAADQFTLSERQIGDEVPAELMLRRADRGSARRSRGVTLVIQEPV